VEVICVDNVHQALPEGCRLLETKGVEVSTRNGKAWALTAPLATTYRQPCQRVLFWKERNANPFFHLMECLWMLAGRNDVAWISEYSSNIQNYSDDGFTFNGAYGYRWRKQFGFDQFSLIVAALKENAQDRRQVLQMWSPADLQNQDLTKDVPCNTSAYFQVVEGSLDMLVSNRSNDLIWGAYGANAVHFSFLQEVVASFAGFPVGKYTQVSMNTHVYERHFPLARSLASYAPDVLGGQRHADSDYYASKHSKVLAYPVVQDPRYWMEDLCRFTDEVTRGYQNSFFPEVAIPMRDAWRVWKRQKASTSRVSNACQIIEDCCKASDWKKAALDWIRR